MSFIENQWKNPDDEFVRYVAKSFYDGQLRTPVVESLKPIVRRAFDDLFRSKAREKIDVAFNEEEEVALAGTDDGKGIVTTEEELQGFMIVRAIAAEVVSVERIVSRDAQSYFAILFDDNNRKPVARLNFNGNTKFVTLFDAEKKAIRHDIGRVEDIFQLREPIKKAIQAYMD